MPSASGSSSGKQVLTPRWFRTKCSRLAAFSMKSLNEMCFCVVLSDSLGHLLLVCCRVSEEETGSGECSAAKTSCLR